LARTQKTVVRKDPIKRHIDAVSPWNSIKGADPERHYVWVNPNSEMGLEYYEHLGYDVEEKRVGGPSVAGGRTTQDGQPITMRGHVLMSCDAETRERLVEVGPDGQGGQREIDRLEDRIIDKRSGMDPLRGMVGLYGRSDQPIMSVRKKISPLQVELGE
jgi:hypothetical protein